GVVRILQGAPVGDVQAPDVYPAADSPQGPWLGDVFEGGLACETALNAVEPHTGKNGDAVPLVDAPVRHLVSGGLEREEGELLVSALGLLDGQDVHLVAFQPAEHALGPGPNGIHVPGSD